MARVSQLSQVRPYAITICKEGANRKRIYLRKENQTEPAVKSPAPLRILKAEGDWATFYCVVAEPDWIENPGMTGDVPDVWANEDEIRKAAHHFAQSDQLVNAFHDSLEPYGTVVENFLAQTDMQVEGETIRKGSWVVGVAPTEEGRRAIEAGELTGVSLEGDGVRTVIEVDDDRTILQKVKELLGVTTAIPAESGNVETTLAKEDDVTPITEEQIQNLETKATEQASAIEDIKKSGSATEAAVTGLVDTVKDLVGRLDAKNKDEDDPKDKLKKSLEGLVESVEDIRKSIDALAEGDSTQDRSPDTQPVKKTNPDFPLAGLLD